MGGAPHSALRRYLMPLPLRSNDQSAPPRERRNWRLRPFLSIALKRGPVRYWTGGALVVAAIVVLLVWRLTPALVRGDASVPYSEAAQALGAHQVSTLIAVSYTH